MTQTPCEAHGRIRCGECEWIEELKERAEAAEAREQRLKEVVKRAIVMLDEIVPHQFDIQSEMEILLSTLYPDTTATKEEDHDN